MAEDPAPRVSRRPQLPLIWVVPVVAALVAGWMLWGEFRSRGPEITIHFKEAVGVEANQTRVQYRGVRVGLVTAVRLDEDLEGVTVAVRLRREAAGIARRGAEFWVVQPRISFTGVSGLETLLAGVHLDVLPGDGPPDRVFRGLDHPPAVPAVGEGRSFRLHTDRMGSMQTGTPVLYRDFQVGDVEAIHLGTNTDMVVIRIRIRTDYADLVRQNTVFWNAGGVPVRFSLFGGSMETASLRSFFTGAIAFATPDKPAEPAPDDAEFVLYSSPEDKWLAWKPAISLVKPEDAPAGTAPPSGPVQDVLPGVGEGL